jgi:hypothetical protein
MLRSPQELNVNDRQVYNNWLRKAAIGYLAVFLAIVGLVSWQAATVTNGVVVVADSAAPLSR